MRRGESFNRVQRPTYDAKGKAPANQFDSFDLSNKNHSYGGYTSSNYMEDRPPSKQGGNYSIFS